MTLQLLYEVPVVHRIMKLLFTDYFEAIFQMFDKVCIILRNIGLSNHKMCYTIFPCLCINDLFTQALSNTNYSLYSQLTYCIIRKAVSKNTK